MNVNGVLVRMMPPGSLEQVVFRMDALHRVAAAGVPVVNPPRAIEAAVDKYLTLALLGPGGTPRPRHLDRPIGRRGAVGVRGAGRRRRRQAALRLRGTGLGPCQRSGAGLAHLSCPGADRGRSLPPAGRPSSRAMISASSSSMGRSWVRCDATRRQANGGRTSRWAAGPSPAGSPPRRSGWRSAPPARWGPIVAGVDLIPDLERGRPVVLEVNAVPGWRALSRVTGIDVAAAVLEAPLKARSGSLSNY